MGPSVVLHHPSFFREPAQPGAWSAGFVGMLIFLSAELMFFAGLISAFLVLRGQHPMWPPLDQPRLPILVTGINTALLLLSGWTMWRAWRAKQPGRTRARSRNLLLTWILGLSFLLIQGYEWIRLLGYGMTSSSSIYGATFYLLIGAHGLHVLAALIVLGIVGLKTSRASTATVKHEGFLMATMYWIFVAAIWPVLYGLVYF